jgi:hypothetical protein
VNQWIVLDITFSILGIWNVRELPKLENRDVAWTCLECFLYTLKKESPARMVHGRSDPAVRYRWEDGMWNLRRPNWE